jgi:hypothetical protein
MADPPASATCSSTAPTPTSETIAGRTALDRASPEHHYLDSPDHEAVATILRPLTTVWR